MGGGTDRGGKATANAYHQSHKEGEGFVAQLLGSFVHDGKEYGACCRVRDKLGDEGADKADGCHNHYGVGATHIKDAVGELLGNARLLDC